MKRTRIIQLIVSGIKKGEETDRVYVFLVEHNQDLDEVRDRILGRKPLPSIHEVFSEV